MSNDDKNESVVLYTTPDGAVKVNAVIKNETLWLTQAAMAELFGVGSQAITKHLKNIYAEGELSLEATCSKMEQVQNEGNRQVSREISFYNLDAIIAVGYRVNSVRATHFRIWATGVLREYIIKGFALDDNRLKKGGNPFGKDYFDELLERVRSIRASERRIWQKITECREPSLTRRRARNTISSTSTSRSSRTSIRRSSGCWGKMRNERQ